MAEGRLEICEKERSESRDRSTSLLADLFGTARVSLWSPQKMQRKLQLANEQLAETDMQRACLRVAEIRKSHWLSHDFSVTSIIVVESPTPLQPNFRESCVLVCAPPFLKVYV